MMLIERSPFLAGLNYAKGQVLTRLKLRGHFSGSTALGMSVQQSVDYANQVVADYLTYGARGDEQRLIGKDIVEIGPGDNLGVALLLLAKGARTVTCVDGFAPRFDAQHNSKIYGAIYSALEAEEQRRVQDVVSVGADGSATIGGDRLLSLYGTPIDGATSPLEAESYDIVLSRAVLEHIGDLEIGWKNMVGCLRLSGEMWHKVDFRCHTLFAQVHPLYFLTVPDILWNLISRPDPTLNRLRLPTYLHLAARDFQSSQFYITHIVGKREFVPHVNKLIAGKHYDQLSLNMIENIRPKLLQVFSNYSDEDLLVTGIFITMRQVNRGSALAAML